MLRIALVTNNPPPYRIPVFERVGKMPGVDFHAVFCAEREPYRHWDLPPMDFQHTFLKERIIQLRGRYIHNNFDVVPTLKRLAPDVIVTDGFYPTQLYAFGYAAARGIAHVPLTDGTDLSEQALSHVHRIVRRVVFAKSTAFISASVGGRRLYESYGISPDRCFISHLCIDNELFKPQQSNQPKTFDFIFCGRIEAAKGPLFALETALATARKIGRKVKILFVGSGSQEDAIKKAAAMHLQLVEAVFHGFAAQRELPDLYRSAKVFLFPTLADVWGVVANEACAAGLPIIVSPHAGVAGELVRDGLNGFVCNMEAEAWAQRAAILLQQPDIWRKFSEKSLAQVGEYSFENAAAGLLDACRASVPAVETGRTKVSVSR